MNHRNKTIKKVSISIASCVALLSFAGYCMSFHTVTENNSPQNQDNTYLAEVPAWDKLSKPSKYNRLYIKDRLYTSTETLLNNSNIDNCLYHLSVTGYDENNLTFYYDEDGIKRSQAQEHSIGAEIYSLKSIDPSCIVGVKYDGNEGKYYSFLRNNYEPNTLGDLLTDLNLEENLKIKEAYYNSMNYSLWDTNVLWEMLRSSQDANYISANVKYDFTWDLTIAVTMEITGQTENTSIVISKDGYLFTNIFNYTGSVFFIGKEKTQQFIDYISST
ncbi:MAG: hypothetical protein HFE39_05835 [Clostridiales bacterium]|jgi:hypothetical protein|nr:hypothetical protein [Clostridiales bacterium]